MNSVPLNVILASGSPRRLELLRTIVADFCVMISNVDEEALTQNDPWETATQLAAAKADAILVREPNAVVIGGDTVVAYQEGMAWHQLSKPANASDAARMLALLSGRTHVVITGFAVLSTKQRFVASDTAHVTFRELTSAEIQDYVATGEPLDKAGAYGVQGGAAGFLSHLEGDIETVIGLPTRLIRGEIARAIGFKQP